MVRHLMVITPFNGAAFNGTPFTGAAFHGTPFTGAPFNGAHNLVVRKIQWHTVK